MGSKSKPSGVRAWFRSGAVVIHNNAPEKTLSMLVRRTCYVEIRFVLVVLPTQETHTTDCDGLTARPTDRPKTGSGAIREDIRGRGVDLEHYILL